MSWYALELQCPRCGKVHSVASQAQIPNGPTEAGTVADLYAGGELPPALARLLDALVWCEWTGEYVEMDDPARVKVWPWPEMGH